MEIRLNNISKKFNKEWIFREISLSLKPEGSIAIIGPNGSGKSTLLQLIAGNLIPTSGEISYSIGQTTINPGEVYRLISMVAPGLALPEEFTLEEFLRFHFSFKKLQSGLQLDQLPEKIMLAHAVKKQIRNFSTGMKQRLKLGIALYADTPIVLLDEPASNLDRTGLDWYLDEMTKVNDEKIVIICSNRLEEYSFCTRSISIMDFKQ